MNINQLIPFFKKIGRTLPGSRSRGGLTDLLSQADSNVDLYEKTYWFEQVLLWLRKGNSESADVRLRYFLQVLEQNPEWKKSFQKTFESLVDECQFLKFFSHTGYTSEHGLWTDVSERVFNRVFPSAGGGDFQEIVLNVFKNQYNIDWLVQLSDEALLQLKQIMVTPENGRVWASLQQDIQEALLILSANVAHHGLTLDIRRRLAQKHSIANSSFLALGAALQKISFDETVLPFQYSLADSKSNERLMEKVRFKTEIEKCRTDIQMVYDNMESSGVSVQMVHKLEVLAALLEQMELLLQFELPTNELTQVRRIRDFVVASAQAGVRGRSIRAHFNRHFYLLSRKIAEKNGNSGEHYIARTSQETKSLFLSAIGGGFIVVGMTVFKTFLIRAQLAPMFMALGIWMIYSLGFLTMQFLGYTLATKIPSFTASHLAQVLMATRNGENQPHLGQEIRLIAKSQAVGLLGNIMGLIPLVLLLSGVSRFLFHGHELMSFHYAEHTLSDLQPLSSLAVPLGAVTGVMLWASSICGGWFENWLVFKGVAESVTYHPRLRRVFGSEWTKKLAKNIIKHSSGLFTNISLGFFFGFVPFIGTLFGLNLDAKHVTISTASAMFALSALHFSIPVQEGLSLLSALVLVGLMNFVVSFTLALAIAAKAQKLEMRWVWTSLKNSSGER